MENSAKKTGKLSPEEMFNIFIECSTANAPVKEILERYNLKPWNLVEIRKKIKEASLQALSEKSRRKGKKQYVSMGGCYEKMPDKIFILPASPYHAPSSPVLAPVGADREPFNVSGMAYGYNHVFLDNQVFSRDIHDTVYDLRPSFIREFRPDVKQLLADNSHKLYVVREYLLEPGDCL